MDKIKKIIIGNTKIILAFVFFASLFVFSGCGLKQTNPAYKVNLEIWGVFDNSDSLDKITAEYKKINPHVGEIKYRKFTVDSFSGDLVNALASGQGPDIFWIHNTWGPSFKDKVEPIPDYLLGEKEFRDNFVDVAAQDFMADGKIYALPLSVDSLALYYNKDIFNSEGITSPPRTWEEFGEDVRRITKYDQSRNIIRAGASVGTSNNIKRPTDLLSLLMLQNGVKMTNDEHTEAAFDKVVNVGNNSVRAGENALSFYTQFANGRSSDYTWNRNMHYSIDAFYEGTSAMMLDYSWEYSTIKNMNSKLNFAVAPIPQNFPNNPVNYANYWAMTVSRNKVLSADQKAKLVENGLTEGNYNDVRIREAWEFLKYLTVKSNGSVTLYNNLNGNTASFAIKQDPAETYLKDTNKPAARRDIIEKQKSDPVLSPFALGNLVAKGWYQNNPAQIEKILGQMIDSINLGQSTTYEALKLGANRVTQTMR
jgi:ABC-type glycerol-3-phosphate transport system substrate-binding protein